MSSETLASTDIDGDPAFEPDEDEQVTVSQPPSDAGCFTDDWLSNQMGKQHCGRCTTLVPEHARVCEECGLAFPGGLDMAGYYADGRGLSR